MIDLRKEKRRDTENLPEGWEIVWDIDGDGYSVVVCGVDVARGVATTSGLIVDAPDMFCSSSNHALVSSVIRAKVKSDINQAKRAREQRRFERREKADAAIAQYLSGTKQQTF